MTILPISIIPLGLEIKLIIEHTNNLLMEEKISMCVTNFDKHVMNDKNFDITESEIIDHFANSSIFLNQEINKVFKITSMNIPWLFEYQSGSNKDLFHKMFLQLILQLINYYYYFESAEEFSIVESTILPIQKEKKDFRNLFFNFNRNTHEQILEHIFNRVSELEIYILNTEKFCHLEDLSNEYQQYSCLQKVYFVFIIFK